jgi:hypothetical protein
MNRKVIRIARIAVALLMIILRARSITAQEFYERPILVVDPGMHTAPIRAAAADAALRCHGLI